MNENKSNPVAAEKDLVKTLKYLESQHEEERKVFLEKLSEKETELNAVKIHLEKREAELKSEIESILQDKNQSVLELKNEINKGREALEAKRAAWKNSLEKKEEENNRIKEETKNLKLEWKEKKDNYKQEIKDLKKELSSISKTLDEAKFSYEEQIENLKAAAAQRLVELKEEYELREKDAQKRIRAEYTGQIRDLKKQLEEGKVAGEEMIIAKNEEIGNVELAMAQKEVLIKNKYEEKELALEREKHELEQQMKEIKQEMELERANMEARLNEKDGEIASLKAKGSELLAEEVDLSEEIIKENKEIEDLHGEIESERKQFEGKLLGREREINHLRGELEDREAQRRSEIEIYRKKQLEAKNLLEDELMKVQVRIKGGGQAEDETEETQDAGAGEPAEIQEGEKKPAQTTMTQESEEKSEEDNSMDADKEGGSDEK